MMILDANMILRMFIRDNEEQAMQAVELIDSHSVLLLPEVTAEVVFVMQKVYQKDRAAIADALLELLTLDNIHTSCGHVLRTGIRFYKGTSLDFVDCLLAAYHAEDGHTIKTFDKKLNKLLERIDAAADMI